MTPVLIRKENWERCMCSVPRPLTSLSPEFYRASLIIFGISRVQDHATITIMQSSGEVVFSFFLSRRRVVTSFLERNEKDTFQKQKQHLEKQRIKPRKLGKYYYFLLIFESTMPYFCTAMRSLEELKKTLNFISHVWDKQWSDVHVKPWQYEKYLLGSGST